MLVWFYDAMSDELTCFRILASLNLPAAIEETRSGELPASLWEKAEKLQNQGGIDYIDRFISELPVILERNKDILNEVRIGVVLIFLIKLGH